MMTQASTPPGKTKSVQRDHGPIEVVQLLPDGTKHSALPREVMPRETEPSPETVYGCVEWFAYDQHPLAARTFEESV